LYNQSVVQKGISENGGTTNEQIIWNTTQAGTRYIKVYGWAGAMSTTDCYDMLLSLSSSSWRTDGSFAEIAEEYDNSIIGVFPNPATGNVINVDYFSVQEDMNVSVQVFDILGRLMSNNSHPVVAGENMIEMNVANLESGFYFVVISNGKSKYSEKFGIN
ncbi:MAG: T9SS type A sorting domain-containing protein, partial [Chitinophagales bacterium]